MKRVIFLLGVAGSLSSMASFGQTVAVYISKPITEKYSEIPPGVVQGLGLANVEDYGPFAVAEVV